MVYDAPVESSFTYDTIVWIAENKSNLNKLQISKNNILKVILSKSRDYRVKSPYKEFNVLSVKNFSTKQ